VLISERKQFIFYHVYKVAGSSIRDVLRPYCSKQQIIMQNIIYGASTLGLKLNTSPIYKFHPTLNEVKEYMGEDFFSYYRFAFVRHPLDWQKSLYFFMRKNSRHHQHEIISRLTFDEYIKWRIDEDMHLMSDLVTDDDGSLLLDDIYRFEDINPEFERLCKNLNISSSLPHKNIAGKGKTVEMKDSTIKEFREAFATDFTNFKYDF
jgi:hypothetical protein